MASTENEPGPDMAGDDASDDRPRIGLRHMSSFKGSNRQRLKVSVFPFLIFRYPENRPFVNATHAIESILTRITGSHKHSKSLRPPLLTQAIQFMILLCGSMCAMFFIVYICFSFNEDSVYPTVGESLPFWLLGRNLALIFLMQYLCFSVVRPNYERIRLLQINLSNIDPDLAYIGVFHGIRRIFSWVNAGGFRLRWFTTFLSDSLLLSLTYVFYFVYGLILISENGGVGRSLSGISNIYRGALTCGFIIYSLEFAPRVPKRKSPIFSGICLFMISMQISDFFLFVFDKQGQSAVARAFGAGAQLFITHSSVLLVAIIGQHHQRAELSPDFPIASVWKMGLVFLLAGVWLTYSIYRESYGHENSGIYNHHWIPVSYPYVLWGISVGGGLVCIGAAVAYCYSKEASKLRVRLQDHVATVTDTQVEHASNVEEEEEEHDFDIMLIVITFTIATVYYSSEVYGFFSISEWWSMVYCITTPIAPIGLGTLAATIWWKPLSRPKPFLYLALLLACVYLLSVEMAEDCHLNSVAPACCEYPWLPDVNHHLEEPNEKPGCMTITNSSGEICLAAYQYDEESGLPIFALAFSSVVDVTRAMRIVVMLGGSELFSEVNSDIEDLLESTTCQDEEITFSQHGVTTVLEPGCYGQFLYVLPAEVAVACDPRTAGSSTCQVSVATLNCAWIDSESLLFAPVDFATAGPEQLTDIDFTYNHVTGKDKVDSSFYSFFKLVGMAALLECFFTLFGVLLKLVFLSECRKISTSIMASKRLRTVVFADVRESDKVDEVSLPEVGVPEASNAIHDDRPAELKPEDPIPVISNPEINNL